MLKLLKKKLIIGLISVATVVGVSTQTLFMLHNANTKKVQAATIKERKTQDVAVEEQKNDENKELNSSTEIENPSNIDAKSEETDNTQIENLNNKDNITNKETSRPQIKNQNSNNQNKQENISFQPEQLNNKNDENKATTDTTQVKDNNSSNINTDSKNNTNTVKVPEVNNKILDYDRTTRIYDNDNITLLRVEYYKNNKLAYYSVVEQFDATTKSYVEKIYNCNCELVRTDVHK